jgi:hypothetical protein
VIRAWRLCVGAMLLGSFTSTTLACGHCIEDTIAAIYDYDVVTRAFLQDHQVVFFSVEGTIAGEKSRRSLEVLVESIAGVDRGSARASGDPAALSAAFDPARASPMAMERTLSRKLAPRGLSIKKLRVMDKQSALMPARRP